MCSLIILRFCTGSVQQERKFLLVDGNEIKVVVQCRSSNKYLMKLALLAQKLLDRSRSNLNRSPRQVQQSYEVTHV